MGPRVDLFTVTIEEVNGNPSMDSASIEGYLLLNGERWRFKSETEAIDSPRRFEVIGEKDVDNHGKYLRIHKIIDGLGVAIQ